MYSITDVYVHMYTGTHNVEFAMHEILNTYYVHMHIFWYLHVHVLV